MSVDHDVAPGRLDRCQITGSTNLFEAIDLGHQAPCDAMPTADQLGEPEVTYPLRLMICPESGLGQIDYVVDGRDLFKASYPYRSGISAPLVAYQHALAGQVVSKLGLAAGDLVVDIGSNDGTLLAGFKRHGMRPLGVEPTDVAKIAEDENGIETIQAFFTEDGARQIAAVSGRAKVVTATNVFAHMADLGEVCRGIEALLADDGVFVSESHYLLDVLEKNQFDTILHEHIRTYSLKSLVLLLPQYGLEVFDVERGDRYGGNIRVYVGRAGRRPVAPAVGGLINTEINAGLFKEAVWAAWRMRVEENRARSLAFLWDKRAHNYRIAAQSCPGRCVPLFGYYGITAGLVPYIGELPGSLKIGRHMPGSHIPVVPTARLVLEQPDIVIINAWHYADAVARQLRDDGVAGKLVAFLPEFRMIEA